MFRQKLLLCCLKWAQPNCVILKTHLSLPVQCQKVSQSLEGLIIERVMSFVWLSQLGCENKFFFRTISLICKGYTTYKVDVVYSCDSRFLMSMMYMHIEPLNVPRSTTQGSAIFKQKKSQHKCEIPLLLLFLKR